MTPREVLGRVFGEAGATPVETGLRPSQVAARVRSRRRVVLAVRSTAATGAAALVATAAFVVPGMVLDPQPDPQRHPPPVTSGIQPETQPETQQQTRPGRVASPSPQPGASSPGPEPEGARYVEVTGSLQRQPQGSSAHGSYRITDGDSGQRYAVSDGGTGLLAPYAGQQVTLNGTRPGAEADRDPARLDARLVRPHARGAGIPERGLTTLSYSVEVTGNVPEGTVFYGLFGLAGSDPGTRVPSIDELGAVALHDANDDGTYGATVSLAHGQRLHVRIARGTSQQGPGDVIYPNTVESTVTLDGDTTVSTEAGPERTRDCTGVRFDGGDAYDVRATGTDCDQARAVAEAAPGDLGAGYTSHGFTCEGQQSQGPRSWGYRCTRGEGEGAAVVTFTAKGAFSCDQVGFEPNTDRGAFEISATGVRCELARSVAADAEGRVPERYRSHGFACRSQATGGELAAYHYNCARSGAQVSFTAS